MIGGRTLTDQQTNRDTDSSRIVTQPVSAPTLALQKGGGAIQGMGEKFSANPAFGTSSMTVPFATSPGRSGFGPQLALSYDSGNGNSPFGFGWSLSLPSITRKTARGLPKYQDTMESDVFILSGSEDLVPLLIEVNGEWVRERLPPRTVSGQTYLIQRYQPRVEGLFVRIERWTNQADPVDSYWRSISRNNITTWYGKTVESRVVDTADPARIFSWLICESSDNKGNVIVYRYKAENSDNVDTSQVHEKNRTTQSRGTNRYPKYIRYGNRTPYLPVLDEAEPVTPLPEEWLFEVVFDYGEHDAGTPVPLEATTWPVRPDPFSSHRAGFDVRTYRLCQRVLMFHHFPDEADVGANCLVRSTDLRYSHEAAPADPRNPIYSFLLAVTQARYRRRADGTYLSKSLPPLEFEYTQPVIDETVRDVDAKTMENLPYGLDGGQYQWVDLNGEGLSGILTEQSEGWFYKRNLSPINLLRDNGNERTAATFGPLELVARKPSLDAISDGEQQLLDLSGDGQLDIVALSGPTPGFFERDNGDGWKTFKPFKSLPVVDWSDPNLKFVDLTGDGHADILITEHDTFCWHPSESEDGFGPSESVRKVLDEELGPRLVFADGTQSIYLADFSGDGLTDLARIRNGEVCYWPNLGYGRFGAKTSMDNAPWFDAPDHFEQRRIRLVDIDGSGVTDILYLSDDNVHIYYNHSGNRWSDVRTLTAFPQVGNLSTVTAVDLLGNGTACLVWSSPLPGDAGHAMRYLDLMGGQKPHLLTRFENNLGAETLVHYAPSTKFYLQDQLAGSPWITRLPFPVHVVERVETFDHISRNRFVTRYAYHHGYFDGVEREFRGFGMVEQWDTEEFADLSESNNFPVGDNVDDTSHIPPVHTKTWFHTGTYIDRRHISDFFSGMLDGQDEGEYYREPGLTEVEARALLLDDTLLPQGLSAGEEREACRSLKGAMLRQEIYSLDGTEMELHPYTVIEQNFTIFPVQRKSRNRHAVFFTHDREVLSYHYERNPADPRINHALTLAVDDYGNVLQSAAIGYGRRQPDMELQAADREKQAQLLITCGENSFTNPVDDGDRYRTPLPSEGQSYELTGLVLVLGQARFSFAGTLEAVSSAARIDYHQIPTDGLQKRIIEQVRTHYRPDDLGDAQNDLLALLPLGVVESLALPGESYGLAFTPEHLTAIYGDRINEDMLTEEGAYVHSEGDTNWWIPSGRSFFSINPVGTPAEELSEARTHFFNGRRIQDPFGETFTVDYDTYQLMPMRTTDPLGNSVSATHDYRVLQPVETTDPNGNRAAVAFDVLGMVVGTATMGKESENLGDFLDGFQADLTQDQIDAFLALPRGPPATELLGNATSRIIYDETRFQRLERPPFVAIVARETHVGDLGAGEETSVQVSLAYSDGFDRIIQNKVQAEPGPIEEGGPTAEPRWVTSGWTIFNNKGNPVRQYEPFFSSSHGFEFGVSVGVSPTLFYDPVGRVVATLYPNHTWEKAVFDPWRQENWDVNDTVLLDPANDEDVGDFFRRLPNSDLLPTWHSLRTDLAHAAEATARWPDAERRQDEAGAAGKAAAHADTPGIVYLDSLGRPFLSIADNGADGRYETRTEQDIEGASLRVVDARGNAVMTYQLESDDQPIIGYDIAGRRLFEHGMDSGDRRVLMDIAGAPIRAWDSRGHVVRSVYDELRRPLRSFVTGVDTVDPNREILFQQTVYGEAQGDALNHRSRIFQVFDGAGVVTSDAYDFKGNPLLGSRQLLANYKDTVDWSLAPALEAEMFTTRTEYDALNRPVAITTPDNSVSLPGYNEANLLERLNVRLRGVDAPTSFVINIDYNAKGQRERITYATDDGSNFTTRYEYDEETFRLIQLDTVRHRDEVSLQDLRYTYDPVGNITGFRDHVHQTVFFDNTEIEPHCDYIYDALYRLIRAEGREHAVQNNIQRDSADFEPVIGIPFPNSPEALQRYTQEYEYDQVGNFLGFAHSGGALLRWKRCYQYALDSNRLLGTSGAGEFQDQPCPEHYVPGPVSTLTQRYEYDVHGNMVRMAHLPVMNWDFKDQLQATSQQVVNDGTPETTYYVYDAGGQRVRKVTERMAGSGDAPTRVNERIYLGGFELYHEYDGSGENVRLERETLHLVNDKQRMALVETLTVEDGAAVSNPASVVRYQLSNHLGSATLELDENANPISYEEYHPYGTSAYRGGHSTADVSLKRYRYTGKEKDNETGLYYHEARYYACWLGRWISCDPEISTNLYVYAAGSPSKFIDPNGRAPAESPIVGPYKTGPNAVGGDHIRQVASQTAGAGAKRSTAPQLNQALSVSTKTANYLDKLGQKIEAAINRAAWGKDYSKIPAGSKGTVTLKSTGTSGVGKTSPATPSTWFEDVKSFFKLREAGVPGDKALKLVNESGKQLDASGTTPTRVPQPPNRAPAALKIGQTLSVETKTVSVSGRNAKVGWASKGMGGFGAALGVLGSFTGGHQVGTGTVQVSEGQTGEGVTTMAEGGANLGLTIGSAAAVKSGSAVIEKGIVAGGLTLFAGIAAAGAVALAAEETRKTIRGEQTMAAEATDFWKDVQNDAMKEEPSFGGDVIIIGAEIAGAAAGFIASGQESLWGLLD